MEIRQVTSALVEERKRLGRDQESIAEALGVSRQLVSAWEVGRQDPKLEQVMAWAAALGVPLTVSIGETGAIPTLAPTLPVAVTKLAAIWDELPSGARSGLVAFLDGLESALPRRR